MEGVQVLLNNKKPIITLLFLAPIMGEVLSGSTPIFEFINPLVIIMLVCLYGVSALLFRELIVRWKKGYASLLIAGLAYGILEEGIILKSFFNPGWVDVGALGIYGRFLDVNWIWVIMLMIFHSLISISAPVILTDLIYPEIKGKSLVSDSSMKILIIILMIDGFFFNIMTAYQPTILHYLIFGALMLLLLYFAKVFPENYGTNVSIKGPIIKSIIVIWFDVLIIPHLLRVLGLPAIFDFILLILLFILFFLDLMKHDMTDIRNIYGYAAGITIGISSFAIFFGIFITPLFISSSIIAILFIIWMIRLKSQLNLN